MKSHKLATTALVVVATTATPCLAFEIHTEELLSHSLLARLILESPRRLAATRQKSGMAFLAEQAVDPQVAFLTERDDEDTNQEEETTVKQGAATASKPVSPAFGLGGKHGSV